MGQESCCGLTGSSASRFLTRPQSKVLPRGVVSSRLLERICFHLCGLGRVQFLVSHWANAPVPHELFVRGLPQSLDMWTDHRQDSKRESVLQDGSHSLLSLITEMTAHHDCHILVVRMMSPVHTQGQGITQDKKTQEVRIPERCFGRLLTTILHMHCLMLSW